MVDRYPVKQGHRYRASISLGLLEQLLDNQIIAAEIRKYGFSEVHVSGGGAARTAEGLWQGHDGLMTVPSAVTALREI